VVVENVTGLLTANAGDDFTALCAALAGCGYRFGAIDVDAAAFVPQSRPRVLIVAVREPPALPPGTPGRAVAAARDRLPPALRRLWIDWPAPPATGTNLALADLLEPDETVRWHAPEVTERLLGECDPVHRLRLWAAMADGRRTVAGLFRRTRAGRPRTELRFDGLAGCLRTPAGGSSRQGLLVVEGGRARTRLITPREGARLMGLPEDYRLPSGVTHALHLVGDGVAVPVVRWLARTVLEPALTSDAEILAN
jgi:DNA (cytosine-5)-methyltransferase 1